MEKDKIKDNQPDELTEVLNEIKDQKVDRSPRADEKDEKKGREKSDHDEVVGTFKGFENKTPIRRTRSLNRRDKEGMKTEKKNNCKACNKKTDDAMIECDACKQWHCQLCTNLDEEGMDHIENETRSKKVTKKTAGLIWTCNKCYNEIIKSDKIIRIKIKDLRKKEEEVENLEAVINKHVDNDKKSQSIIKGMENEIEKLKQEKAAVMTEEMTKEEEERVAEIQSELNQLVNNYVEKDEKLKEREDKVKDIEKQLVDNQLNMGRMIKEGEEKDDQIMRLTEKLNQSETKINETNKDIENRDEKIKNLQKEIETKNSKQDEEKLNEQVIEKQLLDSQLAIGKMTKEAEEKDEQINSLKEKIRLHETKINEKNKDIETRDDKIKNLQTEIETKDNKLEEENITRKALEMACHDSEQSMTKMRETREKKDEKISDLELEIVSLRTENDDMRKQTEDKVIECETLVNSLEEELRDNKIKLQVETNNKDDYARQCREMKMKMIKVDENQETTNIRELNEQITAKDNKISELERELIEKIAENDSKISTIVLRENKMKSDNTDLIGKNANLLVEKENFEKENIQLRQDNDNLIRERERLNTKLDVNINKIHTINGKLNDLLEKSVKDDLELQVMNTELIKEKAKINQLEGTIQHKDQTITTYDRTKTMLENQIRIKESEIRKFRDEKKRQNDILEAEKDHQETIRKGGYDVCYYYIKGKCLKLGDCKYGHPELCHGYSCREDCWRVHLKDLKTEEERWQKRGAVPYKYTLPAREKNICKFAAVGDCWKGDNCPFPHPQPLRRPGQFEMSSYQGAQRRQRQPHMTIDNPILEHWSQTTPPQRQKSPIIPFDWSIPPPPIGMRSQLQTEPESETTTGMSPMTLKTNASIGTRPILIQSNTETSQITVAQSDTGAVQGVNTTPLTITASMRGQGGASISQSGDTTTTGRPKSPSSTDIEKCKKNIGEMERLLEQMVDQIKEGKKYLEDTTKN